MHGLSLSTLGKIICCDCEFVTILPIDLDLQETENQNLALLDCPDEFNLEIEDKDINLNINCEDVNLEDNGQDLNLDC